MSSERRNLKFLNETYTLKFLAVGDERTGKTALIRRIADDAFTDQACLLPDVGCSTKTISTPDGKEVKCQLLDPLREKRTRTDLTNWNALFRGIDVILLTVDMTSRESFNNTTNWIKRIRNGNAKAPIIVIVGTKSDSAEKIVTGKELESFTANDDETIIGPIVTSAKEGINTGEDLLAFSAAAVFKTQEVKSDIAKDNETIRDGIAPRLNKYTSLLNGIAAYLKMIFSLGFLSLAKRKYTLAKTFQEELETAKDAKVVINKYKELNEAFVKTEYYSSPLLKSCYGNETAGKLTCKEGEFGEILQQASSMKIS